MKFKAFILTFTLIIVMGTGCSQKQPLESAGITSTLSSAAIQDSSGSTDTTNLEDGSETPDETGYVGNAETSDETGYVGNAETPDETCYIGNAETPDATDTSENGERPYVLTFEAPEVNGGTITSDCFSDSKLTMINVWATYCNPCLNEMPDLGEIAASYDLSEFQMIGIISDVTEDSAVDDIEYAKELIGQTGANYPHLLLNQSLYSNLVAVVDSVPTTFFVNQKGELLGYLIGAQTKDAWLELINELLTEVE